MKQNRRLLCSVAFLLALTMLLSLPSAALAATAEIDQPLPETTTEREQPQPETVNDPTPADTDRAEPANDPWARDQSYTLADPAPWDLSEFKQVVDVTDPRSVVAYWVWAVTRLAENYNDGMAMMKYLYADIEPFGPGYTEGGLSGRAG